MTDSVWPPLRARVKLGPVQASALGGTIILSLVAGAASARSVRQGLDAAAAGDQQGVLWGAFGFGVALALAALFGAIAAKLAIGLGYATLHRLRVDAYAAVLASDDPADDAQSRLTRDADAVTDVVVRLGPHTLTSALGAGSGLLALGFLSPGACLIALLVLPGSWLAGRWLLGRSPQVYARAREQVGVVTRHLAESVGGAPTLQGLRAERWSLERQRSHDDRYVIAVLAGTRLRNRFYPALTVTCGVLTGAVLLFAAWQASTGAMTVGTAVAVVYALGGVLIPVTQLAGSLDEFLAGRAALARLVALLPTSAPRVRENGMDPSRGIELEGISFAYDADDVVRDLSLRIAPDGILALVGASGAAKSTTLALVAGTLTPSSGTVRVGGHDPRTLRPGQVMLLAQHQLLVPGTVAENIGLVVDATHTDMRRTIIDLGLDAWLTSLPAGLDTVVDTAGAATVDVQAIGLARAALAPASVLLLDEATTALDERQEAQAVAHLRRGRMVMIASHRLSLVRATSSLAVLDGGRLAGQGSHDTLLQTCPAYRDWIGEGDGELVSREPTR